MAIKAQGSQLYAIDPADNSLITIDCVTSIDGIDSAIDQLETTCLENLARTYEAGLATPGAASFGINVDPRQATHVRLHQLKTAGTSLRWALGWSDATGTAPTVDSSGDFELPTTRSWIVFEGYMNSYPFTFGQNAMVTSTVGIQISGDPQLIAAVVS
jgi:hypothetical protein